ncbi:MAG: twin-arginine translocase TatA/TatE family subunit [Planctomycetota bacterium]|nr:MAG: twin-arginine translocase TatA/TatE family subunit [Planctomycetota bacterium]
MLSTLGFGLPGGYEWIIILVVALLIFGSRLPRIMRGLGSSVREFRDGMEDSESGAKALKDDDEDRRVRDRKDS